MHTLLLIVKGCIIGIGKVIPGVSGAMLAISLGLYEKCLKAITSFFDVVISNCKLLISIGIGVLLAIVLGSKMIAFLLEHYYLATMLLFIGLIVGGMPMLYQRVRQFPTHRRNYVSFFLAFLFVFLLTMVPINNHYLVYPSFRTIIYFFIGFIDAATMVIPGISGTAIFMLLGLYQMALGMFASIDSISHILQNLPILIPFLLGLGFGILLISFLMRYLLEKHVSITYFGIMGFQVASIVIIFFQTVQKTYSALELSIGAFLFFIGYWIAVSFDRLE